MYTINANMDNSILLQGIATYPYYLFVFSQSDCADYKEIIVAETDCDAGVFNINVDIPMGVYNLDVYGQSDYANLSQELAEYIQTYTCSVYNPENICWATGVLTDEFNYPLQDQDLNDLLR